MVFESIVVSVLNSTLGQWVEGLDADALKISVFKGEVVLRNLELKESAFDGLGVPVVRALNQVNTALGFESGFVIVVVAIMLDRILNVGGRK